MPCLPDLWEDIRSHLPFLGLLASVLAYIAFVAFLFWAPGLRARWGRITLRILGVVGLVPLVVLVAGILLGVLMNSGNPPAQTRIVQSPDGQQAKLTFNAGFLGRDFTEVTLKRTGCCVHTKVFWHQGPSSFDDPKLEWIDSRHLHITYTTRPDDQQHCENAVADITIVCTAQQWPNPPLPLRPSSPN